MSLEIYIGPDDLDDREYGDHFQLGTAGGVADLGRWAIRLDPDICPDVHHLMEVGWAPHIGRLRGQLIGALESDPPESSVRATVENLIGLIEGRTEDYVAVIGNVDEEADDEDE